MHHKAIVIINEVPTVVETWGRWIEESPSKSNEDIILCIPGNPGVTGYYRKFLKKLYEKLQCPVWIVGHAGHQIIDTTYLNIPKLQGNEQLYSLEGQTKSKDEFFKKYVPADARVFLIGHSIGSHICLNLLKDPEINSKVAKTYLMFPTIEDMITTQNGKILTNIISYITSIVFFLSWIFTLFPIQIQNFLLYCYFKITCPNAPVTAIPSTRDLIHPSVLRKVFYMAYDEMDKVKNLDKSMIEPNMNKLKLYYGATDNWAPPSYYKKMKDLYPNIDAELCVRNFRHAFVLHSPEDVANIVAGWIESCQ